MYLRTRRSETAEQDTDPYVLLLVAMVEQAWKDLQLPARKPGGRSALPTAKEKRQAWQFLKGMMESTLRPEPFVATKGLNACHSERWRLKCRREAERKMQALLSEYRLHATKVTP